MEQSKPSRLSALLARHWETLLYVIKVVIPAILRTGRRPVIFLRWSGMGDIICTIPAALELRKRHPGAEMIYNCDPDFALIPMMGGAAAYCTHFREIGLAGYWYRFLLGGFYHFSSGDDSPGSVAAEPMFKEFCRQFGLPPAESHSRLAVSDATVERVKTLLAEHGASVENLILMHTGPTWPVREWPAAHWATLAEELRRGGFSNVVHVGLGGYMKSQQTQVPHSLNKTVDLGEAARTTIPGAVSLVGALSLEETIALISFSRLFVGIDSGLLHIAACQRISSVGIFGPTLPQLRFDEKSRRNFVASGVDCAGCHHRVPRLHWITGCPYDIKCMKEMLPGEVLRACLAALGPESVAAGKPHSI